MKQPLHSSCSTIIISRHQLVTVLNNEELFTICNTISMNKEDKEMLLLEA